jgi:hypothetical protein
VSLIGRSSALRNLARVLSLSGTRTVPQEIDLDRPITTTFEVGRWADGLTQLVVYDDGVITTGGAGSPIFSTRDEADIRARTDVQSQLRDLDLLTSDFWLLQIDVAVTSASAANLSAATAGIVPLRGTSPNAIGVTTSALPFLLGVGTTTIASPVSSGELPVVWAFGGSAFPFEYLSTVPLPSRISGLRYRTVDNGGGAVSVRYKTMYAFTQPGMTPRF